MLSATGMPRSAALQSQGELTYFCPQFVLAERRRVSSRNEKISAWDEDVSNRDQRAAP
jgi:hypothetical protein